MGVARHGRQHPMGRFGHHHAHRLPHYGAKQPQRSVAHTLPHDEHHLPIHDARVPHTALLEHRRADCGMPDSSLLHPIRVISKVQVRRLHIPRIPVCQSGQHGLSAHARAGTRLLREHAVPTAQLQLANLYGRHFRIDPALLGIRRLRHLEQPARHCLSLPRRVVHTHHA